jgi:hypothetical protein
MSKGFPKAWLSIKQRGSDTRSALAWLTAGVKLRGPEGAQRLRATSASTSELGGASLASLQRTLKAVVVGLVVQEH